jgi:hypothetical protein
MEIYLATQFPSKLRVRLITQLPNYPITQA